MSQHTRRRLAAAAFALVAATAAATRNDSSAAPSIPNDEKTITHALNRIGFGARPGDVDRVKGMGLSAYIEQQLHPERVSDAPVEAKLSALKTLTMSSVEIAREFYIPAQLARREQQRAMRDAAPKDPSKPDAGNTMTPPAPPQGPPPEEVRRQRQVIAELNEQKITRAVYSERQLQEVLVDFWFNHFNVFAAKGIDRILLTEYEREAIRPHVLGRFRDLLEATAKSPAMLFYLDNWLSADPNGPHLDKAPRGALGRGRGRIGPLRPGAGLGTSPQMRPPQPQPNRQKNGLNENYARELMELHTLGVDGGYTQKDIVEVARAFTGWTMLRPGPQMDRNPRRAAVREGDSLFFFDPVIHDYTQKTVLGRKIKAGGGIEDGRQVLDILARHPSTATFIATKLARRFVSDTPPKSLVDRAAARFRETDGNLREVVRAIVTSPEFFAAGAYRAKVKTPFEFVVSALRGTGAEVRTATPLAQTLQQLGQPLYMCQPPTGYSDKAEAWVNSGALINRMNFAVSLSGGRMNGVSVDPQVAFGVEARDGDVGTARDVLIKSLLRGDVSGSTRATLEKATSVHQVAALTIGSPEFQRR